MKDFFETIELPEEMIKKEKNTQKNNSYTFSESEQDDEKMTNNLKDLDEDNAPLLSLYNTTEDEPISYDTPSDTTDSLSRMFDSMMDGNNDYLYKHHPAWCLKRNLEDFGLDPDLPQSFPNEAQGTAEEMRHRVTLGKQLIEEVRKGNWQNLSRYLDLGCSLTQKTSDGNSIIHFAVLQKKFNALKIMTAKRSLRHPFLNQQNNHGQTGLHLAAINADLPMIKTLVKAAADITLQDEKGDLALHIAIRESKNFDRKEEEEILTRIALCFIKCNQIISEEKDDYCTTLRWEAGRRLEKNREGDTSLALALKLNNIRVATELFLCKAKISKHELSASKKLKIFADTNEDKKLLKNIKKQYKEDHSLLKPIKNLLKK